jgi:hypothetical protein
MRVTTLVLALLSSTTVRAPGPAPEPPSFEAAALVGENGWLSMECQGSPPFASVRCRFVLIQLKQDEVTAARNALLEERLRSAPPAAPVPSPFFADRRGAATPSASEGKDPITRAAEAEASQRPDLAVPYEAQKGTCSIWKAEAQAAVPLLTPGQRQAQERAIARLEDLCRCEDPRCEMLWHLRHSTQNATRCSVRARTYELTLHRMGPARWVGEQPARKRCHLQARTVIQREETGSRSVWTYERTTATPQITGDVCGPVSAAAWSGRATTRFAGDVDLSCPEGFTGQTLSR